MDDYKLTVTRKQITLPLMIGDFVAVTAEGINMVDDQEPPHQSRTADAVARQLPLKGKP